ncbi:MAG: SDR family NAD(P)-dependent oxidoreductase, partial [Betaproteobacteria bacterium]|nr:SDR family NAD(P)-dependent oxidoreductase [Betaproteobacteria bacterium]
MSGYKAFDLSGQVALITGGNSGIGLGMAQAVAEAGADVVIWGTNASKNAQALEALAHTGRRLLAFQCDVAHEAQVEEVFAKSVAEMGKVDA